ncbi:hypothetical protein GCM10010954_30030 [Halobacillus andaensis]|uniref:DUF4367 domain-containing protein n=1 Tax=Halobacillus andaensis TaxID=1176239 RepID=A0A917B9I9_HALAA|nr:hypothetical protein [Halobacillus andaensis]MBP2005106.1 hypothetical protein [Halobacillus andaensis]GGF28916.1 hypothetical protein GCM10010954_30030 [Halobacillus andaensis]
MKRQTISFLLAAFLTVLLLTSCKSLEGEQELEIDNEQEETEDQKVEDIIFHSASKESETPGEAVQEQYEVVFSDEESEFPEASSVLHETGVEDRSIVSIRSPEGENNYSVFLYEREEVWEIRGSVRIDANEGESFTDSEGLTLPMEDYRTTHLQLDDSESDMWTFVNDQKVVNVTTFEEFPLRQEAEEVELAEGRKGFVQEDSYGHTSIYYYDRGKVVVVSGTLTEREAIDLAESLPPVSSVDFPKQ